MKKTTTTIVEFDKWKNRKLIIYYFVPLIQMLILSWYVEEINIDMFWITNLTIVNFLLLWVQDKIELWGFNNESRKLRDLH